MRLCTATSGTVTGWEKDCFKLLVDRKRIQPITSCDLQSAIGRPNLGRISLMRRMARACRVERNLRISANARWRTSAALWLLQVLRKLTLLAHYPLNLSWRILLGFMESTKTYKGSMRCIKRLHHAVLSFQENFLAFDEVQSTSRWFWRRCGRLCLIMQFLANRK